ncbi:MAG TPA: cob(I)yrinic acid a,c-diamide adenosyltransferase [Armatimonadota bacterium]
MRIYTRTGDEGETGLIGGMRNRKDSARIEAYGSLDELNSALGWCVCCPDVGELADVLNRVQSDLFCLGSELATPPAKGKAAAMVELEQEAVDRLEAEIDRAEEQLPPLRQFILPGGSEGAARLHLARTICRRSERRVVTLAAMEPVRPTAIRYLNRLSDLLFTLARLCNAQRGVPDVPWTSPRRAAS